MTEHMFELGQGHLSRRVERAAKKEGASLINYTDAQCKCGYGCRPYTCSKSARHWFAGPNLGEPHDSAMAKRVLAAAYASATIADRKLGFGA